jgi:CheY-like chemotaxis protein
MDPETINILLIEDNAETVKMINTYLARYEERSFNIVWKENGRAALQELDDNQSYHILLLDHYLPGLSGLEVVRALKEKKNTVPIVFLTVSKDPSLAVEAMKLGVEDYLIKDEIASPVFPRTLIGIHEKQKLRHEIAELDTRRRRLEAIQEFVLNVSKEIAGPLEEMKEIVYKLQEDEYPEKIAKYLVIMRENVERIEIKMEKHKNLRHDKTVQYIKDIKMIDIS